MKKLIKKIFSSILFAYKNIFHWVLSKIIISFSSYLIGILFAIPFLIIAFTIIYFSPLNLANFFEGGQYLLQDALNNQYWFLLVLILFVFSILALFIGINYRRVLFAKLNFKYIEKEKLKFTKNNYFNINLFIKYVKINLIILLTILLVSLIFVLIFSLLIFIFGGIANINNLLLSSELNLFSIISGLLVILYFLIIIYLIYRTFFSYFFLLEDKNITVIKSIKKSIKKTKGFYKLLKLLFILFLLGVLLLPINYLGQYISFENKNIKDYITIKNKLDSTKLKKTVTQEEYYIYSALKINYQNISDKELLEKYNKNNIIEIIFFIFHFIFIFGIFDLVIANFYKREIK